MPYLHGWEITLGYVHARDGARITVSPELDAPQWLTRALLRVAHHWCQQAMKERQDCVYRACIEAGDKNVTIEALDADEHAVCRALSSIQEDLLTGVHPEMARAAS